MEQITYFINDYLYSISNATGMSLGIVGVLVGLVLMLFGFKIKKIALMVIGFLAGYVGGSFLAERFINPGTVMFSLTPVIVGIAAALVMFAVYYLAIYVMGLSIGGIAGFYLGANLFERPIWGLVTAVVVGVIIGSIALAAEKPIVILGTSFIGYIAFRQGLYVLAARNESIVIEAVCIVLVLAAVVLQFLINKDKPGRGRGERGGAVYSENG
jgi:hypothetical protein